VLDTRTNRSFKSADGGYPALLSAAATTNQVPSYTGSSLELTIIITPSPVLGEELVEALLKLVGLAMRNKEFSDNEAWGYNSRAFERLLAQMSTRAYADAPLQRGRFVILSGDVHYAFTNRMQYKGTLPYQLSSRTPEVEFVVAQLTSSANKNQDKKTIGLHMTGRVTSIDVPPLGIDTDFYPAQVWGYNNPTEDYLVIYTITVTTPLGNVVFELPQKGDPIIILPLWLQSNAFTQKILALYPMATTIDFTFREPDWKYRIDPIFDKRGLVRDINYVIEAFPEQPYNETTDTFLQHYIKMAKNFAGNMTQWSSGKGMVGTNNAGLISFDWPSEDEEKEVIHKLFWRLPSDYNSAAGSSLPEDNTHHHVPLGFNLTEYTLY
jgi:hypothetical protein